MFQNPFNVYAVGLTQKNVSKSTADFAGLKYRIKRIGFTPVFIFPFEEKRYERTSASGTQ
jgi:hypothetical protein